MKVITASQTLLEWFALKAGLVPTSLTYSHFGFQLSKFLLEAVDKGVFEAISHNKVSIEHICTTCNLNQKAVTSLLGVLASMKLLKYEGGLVRLTSQSKKWILKDSPQSLYWLMMFDNRVCFKWMEHVGSFLQTGKGLQYHETLGEEEWFLYQKAMEAIAANTSKEAARRLPVPANATKILDIGGSHGLYSVALCKKHPTLSSVVLDLPAAVEKAKGILEKYGMGERVTYLAGNVLTDDIGTEQYDIIIMANVAHHFTAEQNIAVAKKAFKALRPGGIFSILEVLRQDKIKYGGDMLSATGDFYFALSSTSGTWSLNEISSWQKEAGFTSYRKTSFITLPGFTAVTAKKV